MKTFWGSVSLSNDINSVKYSLIIVMTIKYFWYKAFKSQKYLCYQHSSNEITFFCLVIFTKRWIKKILSKNLFCVFFYNIYIRLLRKEHVHETSNDFFICIVFLLYIFGVAIWLILVNYMLVNYIFFFLNLSFLSNKSFFK